MARFIQIPAASILMVCGGCSYTGDSSHLRCDLAHSWQGKELTVKASITNDGRNPVTLVKNPNFGKLDLGAVHREKVSNVDPAGDRSFRAARRDQVVTLHSGDSIDYLRHSWVIQTAGNGRWHVPADSEFDISEPMICATLCIWWNPRRLPWQARVLKQNILTGRMESSKVIKFPWEVRTARR